MRSVAASAPGKVSTVEWSVIPLNSLPVSNFPVTTGGRVGVGSGAGVVGSSVGVSRCSRSSEIQRYTIAAKSAPNMTSTSRRHVRRRILPTRLLFYPNDDDRNDADHAEDRHHSGRHHSPGPQKFGHELRSKQKRHHERSRQPNRSMFGQQKRSNEQ